MGFEAAAKSGGETKLADYYLAALEFIDPRLEPGCSLDEVLAATEGRRLRLMQAPLIEVREELAALDEALHFIQRVHGGSAAIGDGAQAMVSRLNAIAVVEAPAPVLDATGEPEPVAEPVTDDGTEIEPAAETVPDATSDIEPEPKPEPAPETKTVAGVKPVATYRQATFDFDAEEAGVEIDTGSQPEPEPEAETKEAKVEQTAQRETTAELTAEPVIGTLEPVEDVPAVAADAVVVEELPKAPVAGTAVAADPPSLEPVGVGEPVPEPEVDTRPTEVPRTAVQADEPPIPVESPETAAPDPLPVPGFTDSEFVDTDEWVPPESTVPVSAESTAIVSEPEPVKAAEEPVETAASAGEIEAPPIRIELKDLLMPEPVPVEPEQPGKGRRKRTGPSLREVMIQAQLEAMADHVPKPQPAPDVVARAADRIRSLPTAPEEASVVRIIKGLALICWQAWLALFAGWTVVRLFAWPLPAWGEAVNLWQAGGVLVLGVLAAMAVGRATWLYRLKTRRLLLLAHLTGALICLDLLAWRLAMLNTDGFVAGPSSWAWVAALAGWPLIACLAWLSDLRANRPAKRRS